MPLTSTSRIMSRAEHRLADAAQRREAVLTGNGVTALWSVLTALGLPAGSRVLLPDLACERGPGAVVLAGLEPIFADVRPETGTPCPAALAVAAAALDARAVIPTQLFGRHGRLPTPDPDCPQIVDATQCGIAPHSLAGGAAAVVSFGPGRQLDLGGGGAVLTDDPGLAAAVRAVVAGLGDGGDGILRAVPPWLDTRLTIALARHRDARRRRRARGRLLREALGALPGLYPLDLPEPDVPWRVTLRIPGQRDAVKRALERAGFAPTTLFAPLHRLTGRPDLEYPRATLLAAQLLNLDPARLGDDPVAAARHAAAAAATVLDPPRRNEATHA